MQGVIIDFFGNHFLPPTPELLFADIEYEVVGWGDFGDGDTSTTLSFCDHLGEPPQETVVVIYPSGASLTPTRVNGVISLTDPFEGYQRGDVNNDGAFDLGDGVYLLGALFPGVESPLPISCQDAADANNDGTLDIGDVIALLEAVFGGPALPAPFLACESLVALGCESYDACP